MKTYTMSRSFVCGKEVFIHLSYLELIMKSVKTAFDWAVAVAVQVAAVIGAILLVGVAMVTMMAGWVQRSVQAALASVGVTFSSALFWIGMVAAAGTFLPVMTLWTTPLFLLMVSPALHEAFMFVAMTALTLEMLAFCFSKGA